MLDTVFAPKIKGMYVGGHWVPASRSFDDINPSTGGVFASIPDGGRAETRAAIDAAQAAFPAWSGLMFQERAHLMLKIADIWERRAPEFVAAARSTWRLRANRGQPAKGEPSGR